MLTETQRLGGLYGLLLGDALGVPYEFTAAAKIPPLAEIDLTPPAGFRRAHNVPPGTWSDDGAQALCLLESCLAAGSPERFSVEDFGARLCAWLTDGHCAVDGEVFDVGVQTGVALRAILGGTPAATAGGRDEYANGNGSLMRVLPALLAFPDASDDALVTLARASSLPTHGHPRSHVCAALYLLWARRIASAPDSEAAWVDATRALRGLLRERAEIDALELHVRPDEAIDRDAVKGSGYVVDCLRSARVCARADDWLSGVRAAIALGNDTDTTACVTGGILGVRFGREGLPAGLLARLRGEAIVTPLADALRAPAAAALR